MNRYINKESNRGFTIIELLIVIVIIAILVAITAVSYNGLTKNAKEAVIKSDLKQASTQLELDKAKNGSYPNNTSGLKSSSGTSLELTSTNDTYCLSATTSPDIAFHVTNTNTSPQPGVCSGHQAPQAGGGGGTEIANNTPIQDITQAQCNALPIYDGANPAAIRTVTDNRDGTTRNYEIAKLADNNCWMLTNLKLGKTSGTTTLTPANTNIATNFTLPQLIKTGTARHDNPQAIGPVPGDTGAGATNYGYLYNWPAATAGETRSSITTGNAPYSICPKNWRLPVGGDYNSGIGEFADLDRAFGGTGQNAVSGEPNIAKWNYTGPLKGVLSGDWWDGFSGQSSSGNLWSSSAYPDYSDSAFLVGFKPSDVYPGYGVNRVIGLAVRCLLN